MLVFPCCSWGWSSSCVRSWASFFGGAIASLHPLKVARPGNFQCVAKACCCMVLLCAWSEWIFFWGWGGCAVSPRSVKLWLCSFGHSLRSWTHVASWVRWWGRSLCFTRLVSADGAVEDTWTGGHWDGLLVLLSRRQVMVQPVLLHQSLHLWLVPVTLFCKEMEVWNTLRVLKMNSWYVLLYVWCCLE